jgi:hypothetical protein
MGMKFIEIFYQTFFFIYEECKDSYKRSYFTFSFYRYRVNVHYQSVNQNSKLFYS